MPPVTPNELRRVLADAAPSDLWRSIEARTDAALRERLAAEFPQAHEHDVDRRTFLELMGASIALAGLQGCTKQPTETIVPFVRAPEFHIPGKPLFYATALVDESYAVGVLVESHEFRPTRIDGNPLHPASLGGIDPILQAAVLGLYDPDRSSSVLYRGMPAAWSRFSSEAAVELARLRRAGGRGLRILTSPVLSPTLAGQLDALQRALPEMRAHVYTPLSRHAQHVGAARALGRNREIRYDLEQAEVIVAVDCDLLYRAPGHLRHARFFAARRREAIGGSGPGLRLYAVESTPTVTGANADHRLRMRRREIGPWLRSLAQALGVPGFGEGGGAVPPRTAAVARDLQSRRGRGVIAVGPGQPAEVHALGLAINAHLGNLGGPVQVTEPIEAPVDPIASLSELTEAMGRGEVEMLFILGGNPVYDAPRDLDFADALDRVPWRAHLGLYADETSRLCHWHVPQSHPLESWSDTRAYDGTVSIVQPLIAPLYPSHTDHEMVALIANAPERSAHELVRGHWQRSGAGGGDFEGFWRRALHDGLVADTSLPPVEATVDFEAVARGARAFDSAGAGDGIEITFDADPNVTDGRWSNNAWLQELPKPITKLAWDNAALLSPATAKELGVANGDVLELTAQGAANGAPERSVRAPVWVVPGQADRSIHLPLGYGRPHAGTVGSKRGFDAYALRTTRAMWTGVAAARPTGARANLVSTQDHHSLEGRDLLRVVTEQELTRDPNAVRGPHHQLPTLYPEIQYEGHQWGMAIDLDACIGCNACTIACQSENNIPVVGKDQVAVGREMHWIRVDRYFEGSPDDPAILHQPVPCMHCETAPCEVVCPVNATVHGPDGLNQMVYNRCVGTRYCSNNCPYKVRRFNFGLYSDWSTRSLASMRNPDVTVRSRGVMEKCTYCVQRITEAGIAANKEGRPIRDGEVVPACAQACPTRAIVFGDVNDPESAVSRVKSSPRNYQMLAELNTRPRTSYLARVRRPNPDLEES